MITNSVLRAGLYERVSTGSHDSAESRSVERQNQKGREEVTRQGWRLAARYSDPGLSASRFATKVREDWRRLMADIRAGCLDVVVLWIPSRGSRELENWAAFLNACSKHGVLIYLTQKGRTYDTTDNDDWDFLARQGVESVTESNRTSLLTRDGVADSVNRGDPYGRVPFGYRRRYESNPSAHKGRTIHQEPDEAEAPIVREIIERLARSDPISGIVSDFRNRDIRTRAGGYWSQASVRRIVSDGVVYIGKRRHKDDPLLIDGNWPPLVDEVTYWRAVSVLNDPARKPAAEKRGGIRPGAAKWLLSYIAQCSCGAPLGVQRRPRAGQRCQCDTCLADPDNALVGELHFYRCASSTASHAYAPMEWLDSVITETVIRVCSTPDLYAILTREEDQDAQAARDEAEAERARLAEIWQQVADNAITTFGPAVAKMEAHIAELDERARSLSVPPALRDLLGSPVPDQESREKEIRERWLAMPLTSRRAVVRTLFAPTLKPAGRGGNPLDLFRVKLNPRWREDHPDWLEKWEKDHPDEQFF